MDFIRCWAQKFASTEKNRPVYDHIIQLVFKQCVDSKDDCFSKEATLKILKILVRRNRKYNKMSCRGRTCCYS